MRLQPPETQCSAPVCGEVYEMCIRLPRGGRGTMRYAAFRSNQRVPRKVCAGNGKKYPGSMG